MPTSWSSYNSDPMGAALDRWITGNYGEDQWSDEEETEEEEE